MRFTLLLCAADHFFGIGRFVAQRLQGFDRLADERNDHWGRDLLGVGMSLSRASILSRISIIRRSAVFLPTPGNRVSMATSLLAMQSANC